MTNCTRVWFHSRIIPSVAEWFKELESDASVDGERPVQAPVQAATLCPYANGIRVSAIT